MGGPGKDTSLVGGHVLDPLAQGLGKGHGWPPRRKARGQRAEAGTAGLASLSSLSLEAGAASDPWRKLAVPL